MKHTKQFADKLIGYDNEAPTAWLTLFMLVVLTIVFIGETFIDYKIAEANYELSKTAAGTNAPEEAVETRKTVQIITTAEHEKEELRQEFLDELRECESTNYDHAIGDGGASVGPYQWQKPTLEEKVGRSLTYDEYYALATDYEFIHPLTYKVYFEEDERWRWKRCTQLIGYAS